MSERQTNARNNQILKHRSQGVDPFQVVMYKRTHTDDAVVSKHAEMPTRSD